MNDVREKILAVLPLSETALRLVVDAAPLGMNRALAALHAEGEIGVREYEGRPVLVRRKYGTEHARLATRRHMARKRMEVRHAA